jgi:DNA repair exonuclease SbcCD ATPase subunit
MKINAINITNVFGAASVRLEGLPPVMLLAGPNGSGKSSIGHAVGLALCGDLARVALKKDCALIIHDGAKSGTVSIELQGRQAATAHVTKTKATTPAAAELDSPAMRVCTGIERVGELTPNALRALVFGAMGVRFSAKKIAEMLLARGHAKEHVETVAPIIASGFDNAERFAKECAAEARGEWKGATGEVYGSEKALTWAAPSPEVDAGAATKAAQATGALSAEMKALSESVGAARQRVENARAAANHYASQAGRLGALVGTLTSRTETLSKANKVLAETRTELQAARQAAGQASRRGEGLVHWLAELLGEISATAPAIDAGDPLGADIEQALESYTATHGDIVPVWEADPAVATEGAREAVAQFEALEQRALQAVERAQAEVDEATQARSSLAALDQPAPVDTQDEAALAEAQTKMADLDARYAIALATSQELVSQVLQAERAAELTAAAAAAHGKVVAWQAIEADLSPAGIPAELTASGITRLQDRLEQSAADTAWPSASISPDWVVCLGGRPYGLLSRSEQWRADAMLAEAIAHFSGIRAVVLDEMDLLNAGERMTVLAWLSACAEAGELDTALVIATLGTLPPSQALPAHTAAAWVAAGRCEYEGADATAEA